MVYVALLRGINVGGKAIISMATLRTSFEKQGLANVRTYINSGNIIFTMDGTDLPALRLRLEGTIEEEYKLAVKVLIKSYGDIQQVVAAMPSSWVNGNGLRCYVLFLWPEIDSPDILQRIPQRPEMEELRYVRGAVLHQVEQKNIGKSRLNRLASTELYASITIRNVNTVRKILALMEEA